MSKIDKIGLTIFLAPLHPILGFQTSDCPYAVYIGQYLSILAKLSERQYSIHYNLMLNVFKIVILTFVG